MDSETQFGAEEMMDSQVTKQRFWFMKRPTGNNGNSLINNGNRWLFWFEGITTACTSFQLYGRVNSWPLVYLTLRFLYRFVSFPDTLPGLRRVSQHLLKENSLFFQLLLLRVSISSCGSYFPIDSKLQAGANEMLCSQVTKQRFWSIKKNIQQRSFAAVVKR